MQQPKFKINLTYYQPETKTKIYPHNALVKVKLLRLHIRRINVLLDTAQTNLPPRKLSNKQTTPTPNNLPSIPEGLLWRDARVPHMINVWISPLTNQPTIWLMEATGKKTIFTDNLLETIAHLIELGTAHERQRPIKRGLVWTWYTNHIQAPLID